jgi:hypothetical protein
VTTALVLSLGAAVDCGGSGATGGDGGGGAIGQQDGATSRSSGAGDDAASSVDAIGTMSPLDATGGTSRDAGTPPSEASTSDAATSSDAPTPAPASLVFSPYKDTSINMNWNTNVASTLVSGTMTPLAADMAQNSAKTITLAFATGACGAESWGGIAGNTMASANVSLLTNAGVKYVVSTGGAAGSFTCTSDTGMATFIGRWASPNLVGIDFDIEAGDQTLVNDLIARIHAAHTQNPGLRFSLTLATVAASGHGATIAQPLGAASPDNFNTYGDWAMAAVKSTLGFTGTASSWPSYLTINLMTMDYGSAGEGNCVVVSGACQMGKSAIQAAYDLHDHWSVPYANIEVTPMIGGNDTTPEQFTLGDVDTLAHFAVTQGLAGVHYWSYDRDTDCTVMQGGSPDCSSGAASPTRNSMGSGYAGPHGYLKRFMAAGLR